MDPRWIEAVAVPIAAIIGGAFALYVKDKARTTAKEEFRAAIKGELAIFRSDFLTALNGRYVYSNGANVTGAEIERRLEALEQRPPLRHRQAEA